MPPSAFSLTALLVPKIWIGQPDFRPQPHFGVSFDLDLVNVTTRQSAVDSVSLYSDILTPVPSRYNYLDHYNISFQLASYPDRHRNKTHHIPMLGKLSQGPSAPPDPVPPRLLPSKAEASSARCSAPNDPTQHFILV